MSQRKLQRTRPLLKPANKDLGLADVNQPAQRAVSSKTRSSSNSRATSALRTGPQRASTASHSAPKSRNSIQSARGAAQEKDFTKPTKSAKAPTSIADRPAFNLDLGGPPASSHSRTGLRAPAKSSINVHAYTTKERAELLLDHGLRKASRSHKKHRLRLIISNLWLMHTKRRHMSMLLLMILQPLVTIALLDGRPQI